MAGLTRRYYSLSGGLNTTQGVGTINQSTNNTESPETFNVEPYKLSGLKSMDGNKPLGNALPSSITLGHEYIKDDDKYLIVTTVDGNVYIYNKIANTYDKIYKFPSATQRHSACNFNQGVVLTNGVDDLVYYQYGRNNRLTGTVTIQNDTTAIVGDGTAFTTQLAVGDYIRFEGVEGSYRVDEITSDTAMVVSPALDFPTEPITYYCWQYTNSDGTVNTYYTTTLADGTDIPIYEYTNSKMVEVDTADISNGVLVYEVTTNQIVTVERPNVSWTNPELSSNSSYGSISYTGTWHNPGYIYKYTDMTPPSDFGEYLSRWSYPATGASFTWTFPQKVKITSCGVSGYDVYDSEAYGVSFNLKTDTGVNLLNIVNGTIPKGNWGVFASSVVAEGVTSVTFTANSHFYPSAQDMIALAGLQLKGFTYSEVEEIQQVTTGGEYTRVETSDVSLIVPTEGVNYYMTPISELNAVYINSDDETVNYPIRGLAINSYQGRLFVGGNDGNLYYSELGLIHGWDAKYDAGAIPPFYNDNSDFTGLGVYGNYLVIHKRWYSYILDGSGTTDTWEVQPYADISCDSQQSWIVANNAYYIFAKKNGGIYPLLSRTIFTTNYLGKEISVKIRESFKDLNQSLTHQIFPVYHPTKKYLMFYMPMLQGDGSNYCFIYDFISQAWWQRRVPQIVTVAFRYNDRIYIGTQDGLILEEFKSLTFNGQPIEFSWKSPWFDFGDGTNYLSIREFRCKISEEYTNNFYVRNRRDGYDDFHQRNITNDKTSFEALVWSDDAGEITDTVWDEYEWVESGFLIRRFPLPDMFFSTEQIEFYGKVENEAMCLLGFELDRIEHEEVTW